MSAPFSLRSSDEVRARLRLSLDGLVSFITTQASTIHAVCCGYATLEQLEGRLRACLAPFFPGAAPQELEMGGPLHLLQRGPRPRVIP